MCTPDVPKAPPPPPPRPDFKDEAVALSTEVEETRRKQRLAGLASTISGAASGIARGSTSTTRGVK